MKKALLILVLWLTTSLAFAQGNKIEIGIEGGPNFSGMADPNNPDGNDFQYWVMHFSTAITGQYNFDSIFSIKSGLSFEKKGFVPSYSYNVGLGSNVSQYVIPNAVVLNYLLVPVLAKISTGEKAKFFVNGGPYFAYLFQANNIFSVSDSKGIYKNYSSHAIGYKPIDIGAVAGFGFDIPLSPALVLDWEFRCDFGFTNTAYPIGSGTNINQSINLLFGLRYRIQG